MIQAIRETNFSAYISTKENRIDTSVDSDKIKHLFKFSNDMNQAVFYAYATTETYYDFANRYRKFDFTYNTTPNRYNGRINLIPAGYFKYEVYEVSWIGTPALNSTNAPATELVVLPVDNDNGIVQGLVAIGKLYLSEKSGSEEVQYTQNAKSVQTLTIQEGGSHYGVAPTITIGTGAITTATATCTISGGAVNTVTITDAGSGYTENPTVTLTGGGFATPAIITANVNQSNYIYNG